MPNHSHDDESTIREMLEIFGLTEKEIDVYLAVLRLGEATTSTIAEKANVSQQAVYTITERLADRGFVRVNSHASPKTISAIPPEESMGRVSSEIGKMTGLLDDLFNEPETQTPELRLVQSRKTAINRLRDAISQARNEIVLAIPERIYPDIESELQDARDRGVLVFLLIQGVSDDKDRFRETADAVRYWNEEGVFLYTVDIQTDNKTSFIGDSDLVSGTHRSGTGVVVSQRHLCNAIHGIFFSTYWASGVELFVTEPYALPRRFEWFRAAVFHAFLHDRSGTELRADIEVQNGETVSGAVTEIRQAFVEPVTSEFYLETALFLETAEGRVSVGGPDSFIEDYEAAVVTLRSADQ